LRLARATDWREQPGGAWHGIGQRMLTTDQAEIALLDARVIALDTPLVEPPAADEDAAADSTTEANG
jgi:type VI secretion system protein ImpE